MPWFLVIASLLLAAVFGLLHQYQLKQRRRAEKEFVERLRKQKRRLLKEQDRLLNAFNQAFLLLDPTGKIVFANDQATELVSGRKIIGRHYKEAFLDERITDPIDECLETGRSALRQIILPQQASPRGLSENRGETCWFIDAAPLNRNATKTVTRIVIRDQTDEHQTEQIRKDFIANASHELRTPLSIINGYLENFSEGYIEDSELSNRAITVMQKHGTRLARLVEDMLLISRLESGEADSLNLASFPLQICIQDVLERLDPLIIEQKAIIENLLPEEKIILNGDRFYWTQAFFNLIENALKQNAREEVTLEIGSSTNEFGGLKVWIADNGVGIPSSDLPFIFRRFYRVEKHHNQAKVKGTGLGLSIVKRTVEAHHGTINVTSIPGQRTAFTIELPGSVLAPAETFEAENEASNFV